MDICKYNPSWGGGYFVYHQVTHSKTPHYAHSTHSCVFMDLRTNSCYSLVQNRLVFVTQKWRVYCAVGTDPVNIINVHFLLFSFASVIPQTMHTRLRVHVALARWTELPTGNGISEIREFWVDKYLAFVNVHSRQWTWPRSLFIGFLSQWLVFEPSLVQMSEQ